MVSVCPVTLPQKKMEVVGGEDMTPDNTLCFDVAFKIKAYLGLGLLALCAPFLQCRS